MSKCFIQIVNPSLITSRSLPTTGTPRNEYFSWLAKNRGDKNNKLANQEKRNLFVIEYISKKVARVNPDEHKKAVISGNAFGFQARNSIEAAIISDNRIFSDNELLVYDLEDLYTILKILIMLHFAINMSELYIKSTKIAKYF